jgi:hypothetical protein
MFTIDVTRTVTVLFHEHAMIAGGEFRHPQRRRAPGTAVHADSGSAWA